MSRKLKVLGLALMAVFAMSAISASASQAAGVFTWASGTTELKATQSTEGGTQIFTVRTGEVRCNEVTGAASVSGTEATEVSTSSITYNNSGSEDTCPGPLSTNPKIEMNGCGYKFTAGETIGESGMETTASVVHITCPETKKIKINNSACTVEVPAQTPTGGHLIFKTMTNTPASPDDVTVEATVTGISYSQSGPLCIGGTGSFADGTYRGNITVIGTNASHVQTEVSVH